MLALAMTMLLQAGPETAAYATRADYRQWPNAYDWYLATPSAVLSRGLGGRAVLACKVTDMGLLAKCRVREEDPTGEGFGKAAMKLRGKMRMTPSAKGEARWVLVPFQWRKGAPYLPPSL